MDLDLPALDPPPGDYITTHLTVDFAIVAGDNVVPSRCRTCRRSRSGVVGDLLSPVSSTLSQSRVSLGWPIGFAALGDFGILSKTCAQPGSVMFCASSLSGCPVGSRHLPVALLAD